MTRLDAVQYISHGISKSNDGFDTEEIIDDKLNSGEQNKNSKKALDQFCVNLNEKSKLGRIDPLIGRDQEVERTIQILCRRNKNNPLYVGDPGVGKTAIAEGLAKRILEKKVPSVQKRIKVMKKLVDKGWKIGLRFDPIIPACNFTIIYEKLIK